MYNMNFFTIQVKVIPKASRNEIVGWEDEELKIRIKAVQERGKANEMLIRFLADTLKIAKSQIEIARGETNRHKRLNLYGIDQATCMQIIGGNDET